MWILLTKSVTEVTGSRRRPQWINVRSAFSEIVLSIVDLFMNIASGSPTGLWLFSYIQCRTDGQLWVTPAWFDPTLGDPTQNKGRPQRPTRDTCGFDEKILDLDAPVREEA